MASGVVDTATGAKVFLFSEGGTVVGRVGTKGADGAADRADAKGVALPENLFGTAQAEILAGLGGGDNLFGFGGDDVQVGGPGGDNLFQVIDALARSGSDSFQGIVDKINAGGPSSPLSIQTSGRDATVSLGGTVKTVLKGVSADAVFTENALAGSGYDEMRPVLLEDPQGFGDGSRPLDPLLAGKDHVFQIFAATDPALGDREEGPVVGVAIDREDRHVGLEIDGIVAPFTAGDAAAIERKQSIKVGTAEIGRRFGPPAGAQVILEAIDLPHLGVLILPRTRD